MDIVRSATAARQTRRALTLLLSVSLAAGCTSEQVYNAAQGWRRNECYKLGDPVRRESCLKEADRPYDAYRGATGSSP